MMLNNKMESTRKQEIKLQSSIFINSSNRKIANNSSSRLKKEVQIVSKEYIKPFTPTPGHLNHMKISFLDHMAPPAYIHMVFYYPANHDLTIQDRDERCNKLKVSLSRILSPYYPLAGRYMRDKYMVSCNDEGAEYVEANVSGELLVQEESDNIVEFSTNCIPYQDEVSITTSIPLKVRVNKFDCGGLVVGICMSHKIADGLSTATFINEWATLCRQGLSRTEIQKSINFNLGSVFPPRDCEFSTPVPQFGKSKFITKRFVFSGTSISKLKDDFKFQASRVKVVIALIWKTLIRIAELKHGQRRASFLSFPVNIRGKSTLIPDNSYGNLYKLVLARFKPDENELELHSLVSLLDKALGKADSECSELKTSDDLFTLVSDSMKEINEKVSQKDADMCVFSSWCRFPYYDADFGWGKPSWVTSANKPLEITLLMDTECGEGIEALVSLEEENMHHFQLDQDIVSYTLNQI